MSYIHVIPERCGACLICELVCTFHHSKYFATRQSSIEVRKIDADGDVELRVHDEASGDRPACDGCQGEERPLCIKLCPVSAIVKAGKTES